MARTSARQGDACATKSSTPKPPEEVAALVGFPDQTESDVAPAGFFTQVATKVPIAEDHTSSDVQQEIFHLLTVAGLIAVADASEHCRTQTGQHVSPDILQSSNMCLSDRGSRAQLQREELSRRV
ncbi:hypothetical protein D4764_03G0010010 [Takifugu flavidus]|uniref:Uncharacterized protein n=1 Tax=Takifugu flavidus TaxID=433684 RepID=A0A5C6NA23_9TELE|nr:hypothetical protein D4764_03G0010010 [Takifugu flavidus]